MTTPERPPKQSEIDDDFDQAWEALHEYDRYHIDTTILKAASDMWGVLHGLTPFWSDERKDSARQSMKLLDARYQELAAGGETQDKYVLPNSELNKDNFNGKSRRVLQEWMARYFLLRAERAGVDQYNEWVVAHAEFAGLDEAEISRADTEPGSYRNYYRTFSPIELVPLRGEYITIIVPPRIEISGEIDSRVFLWDDVDEPTEVPIELFPSTRLLLVDRLGLKQFIDTPLEDAMIETELALAKAKNPPQ